MPAIPQENHATIKRVSSDVSINISLLNQRLNKIWFVSVKRNNQQMLFIQESG